MSKGKASPEQHRSTLGRETTAPSTTTSPLGHATRPKRIRGRVDFSVPQQTKDKTTTGRDGTRTAPGQCGMGPMWLSELRTGPRRTEKAKSSTLYAHANYFQIGCERVRQSWHPTSTPKRGDSAVGSRHVPTTRPRGSRMVTGRRRCLTGEVRVRSRHGCDVTAS
jgi:hypothetical protein